MDGLMVVLAFGLVVFGIVPQGGAQELHAHRTLLQTPSTPAVYPTLGCSGSTFFTLPASPTEPNCRNCWDSCGKSYPGQTSELHGTQHSVWVPPGWNVTLHLNCVGQYGYTDPGLVKAVCGGVSGTCTSSENRFFFGNLQVQQVPVDCGIKSSPSPSPAPPAPSQDLPPSPPPPPPAPPLPPGAREDAVIVYPTTDCTGSTFFVLPASPTERYCTNCWDSCIKTWPGTNTTLQGTQRSVWVPVSWNVSLYGNCIGNYIYTKPEYLNTLCPPLTGQCLSSSTRSHPFFGNLHVRRVPACPVPAVVSSAELPPQHSWTLGLATDPHLRAGFSWWGMIHSVLQTDYPLANFQVGLPGAWSYPDVKNSQCMCPAESWPASEGCCSYKCNNLFQTIEGGPGYWTDMIPTTAVKWRLGMNANCYNATMNNQHWGSPLAPGGTLGDAMPCDKIGGVITVTNRLLLAPDGFTVAKGAYGMFGRAVISSRLGARSVSEVTPGTGNGNSWLQVIDATNFAGPISYTLPEWWHGSSWNPDLKDMSYDGTGIAMQVGFEWNTMPLLASISLERLRTDPVILRLPRMGFPVVGGANETVLMMSAKSWARKDVSDVLEAALAKVVSGRNASSVWRNSKMMQLSSGYQPRCANQTARAELSTSAGTVNGIPYPATTLDFGGEIVTGTVGGECVTKVKWDPTARCNATWCPMPEYFRMPLNGPSNTRVQGAPFAELPWWASKLQKANFSAMPPRPAYSVNVSSSALGFCYTQPGPALATLFCVKTTGSTWIGYKWFRYVDQPALQRLNLTSAQRDFMQSRIVALHKILSKGGLINRWIKRPPGIPSQIITLDPALTVTPPAGMEAGYVPIVMYEGATQPSGCVLPS